MLSTYFAEGLPFSIVHQMSAQFFTFVGASLEDVGLTALYGFARLADDLGDEPLPGLPSGAGPETVKAIRLRLLDDLQKDVAKIYEGGQP